MAGTVLITGANGTLALEFVRAMLVSYPEYTIVATVRNCSPKTDPNTAKLQNIIDQYPKSKVKLQQLDLGKLDDVRTVSRKLADSVASGDLPHLSAIVCNAATWSLEAGQKFSSDGLETTFQVCHLAHFLLVLKLLESMQKSGRVVMLGSITHYPEKKNPLSAFRPEFPEDLTRLARPPPDNPEEVHDRGFQRYGTAKLANVTFMHDLNNRLQKTPALSGITALAMDPGGLPASRAQAGQRKSAQRMMSVVNFAMPVLKHVTTMFRPTADAARDLAAVSVDPEFRGKRGYYVGRNVGEPAQLSKEKIAQDKLWAECAKLVDLKPADTVLPIGVPA